MSENSARSGISMTREAVTLEGSQFFFFFFCMARGQTGIGFDGVYETQVGER